MVQDPPGLGGQQVVRCHAAGRQIDYVAVQVSRGCHAVPTDLVLTPDT